MINWLNELFNNAGFMPHGHCYLWKPALVWSMVTSDALIGVSYFVISLSLLYLVKKIKVPFSIMFIAFGLFIAACGLGHFVDIFTLWIPAYWVSAAIKIITAGASVATAVSVFIIMPGVFRAAKDLQASTARKGIIDKQMEELNQLESCAKKEAQIFEAILASSTDQIYKMDKDGRFDYVSPAVIWQLRREQNTILGKKWQDLGFSAVSAKLLDAECSKTLNGEAIVTGEVGFKSFQGLRSYQYIITPIYSENRELTGIVANLRDITDRKEYEERFQLLVKEVKDYAIFMLDPSGKVVSWNEGAANIKGYSEKEVIGRHYSMFFVPDEIRDGLPQEDLKNAEKNGHYAADGWRVKKDGSRFYASFVITALRDVNGSLRGFAKVTHDVTARKKAEDSLRCAYQMLEQSIEDRTEELQLLNERYQELVNTLDGVVWEANIGRPGYTFVSRQAEHILGYPMEKWEQTPSFWQTILHKEDKDRIAGSGYKSTKIKCDSQNEYRMITAAGKTIWMREYIKVFFDNNVPSKMRGIMVDITERKQAEARLRLAEQNALKAAAVKAEFLANMSHEIRTPLNAIIGMASVSLDMDMSEELRDSMSTIKTAGDSLLTLINDILDFSKIEAGKLQLEYNDFSLSEVAQNVINLAQPLANAKHINLKFEQDQKLPDTVCGDAVRVLQVLLNLISNAIKFSTANETVTLKVLNIGGATKDKVKTRIEVIDAGIGISDEGQSRLFQPFTQGDTSTARKYGGTGLGLSICKRLVELMSGKIGVTSVLGKGSTFWIELDLQVGEGKVKSIRKEIAPESKKLREFKKILVADDNFANQKVILRFLKKIGFDSEAVNDGRAAVQAFEKNKYDLILMDCQMPEMDGYEAVRTIRLIEQKAGKSRLPIIALTAHALSGDRKKCQEAGMDDYLTKPISISQLEDVLSHWLEGREAPVATVPLPPNNEAPIDFAYIKSLDVLQEDGHPDVVIELIEHFSAMGPKKIQSIKSSMQNGDHETVKREAHNFKSTCFYVGARKLGHICQEIEDKANATETPADVGTQSLIIKRLEAEFTLALSNLEVLMRERKQRISA